MKKNIDGEAVARCFTGTWERHDRYEHEMKTSRWIILKMLIRGTMKLRWWVPVSQKRKGLYLKGKEMI